MAGFQGGGLKKLFPVIRNVVMRTYAEAATSHANQMQFTFACPAKVFYDAATNVRQVDVSSFSGSFGILPQHVPVLAAIKPGVITVFEEGGTIKRFFASSGSVSVNDDSSVQVLAEEAVPVEDLDIQAARECLGQAQREAAGSSSDEERTDAQVKVEVYEAIVKAAESA